MNVIGCKILKNQLGGPLSYTDQCKTFASLFVVQAWMHVLDGFVR